MIRFIKILSITLLIFSFYFALDYYLFYDLRKYFNDKVPIGLAHIITYLIVCLPLFLGFKIIPNKKEFFKAMGLNRSPLVTLLFMITCTLPLFIGFGLFYENKFNEFTTDTFLIRALSAGFFEELIYRAFLFGLLFRYTRLGFIPSIMLCSIIFGLTHIDQGNNSNEIIGIFAITSFGSILFSWVYAEWNFNLWSSIFLHLLMNLAWEIYDVSDNAVGSIYSDILRCITILFVVIGTIYYKHYLGRSITINRKTIWLKKHVKNQKKSLIP